MLSLITSGAVTSLASAVPGGGTALAIGSEIGSFLGKIDTSWFGGSSTDANRKARVAWLLDAASRGSVLAAQIIYAGPDNVAGDEDPYWQAAQRALQTGSSIAQATWAAAISAGKFWPVGQPFSMPAQVQTIIQQLAALGQPAPGGAIPTAQPGGQSGGSGGTVQTALGNGVQTVGSQIVNGIATGINPSGGYVTIPTSSNTLIGWGLAIGAVVLLLMHAEHKERK